MARQRALNDTQIRELAALTATNPHLTTRQLARLMGTSQTTIIRRLHELTAIVGHDESEATRPDPPGAEPRPIVLLPGPRLSGLLGGNPFL